MNLFCVTMIIRIFSQPLNINEFYLLYLYFLGLKNDTIRKQNFLSNANVDDVLQDYISLLYTDNI